MKKLIGCAVVLFALTGSVHANKLYGAGLISCGRWTDARAEAGVTPDKISMTEWIDGYISAISVHSSHLLPTDVEGMEGWLDNYCREHPLDTLQQAAQQLAYKLDDGKPNTQ